MVDIERIEGKLRNYLDIQKDLKIGDMIYVDYNCYMPNDYVEFLGFVECDFKGCDKKCKGKYKVRFLEEDINDIIFDICAFKNFFKMDDFIKEEEFLI